MAREGSNMETLSLFLKRKRNIYRYGWNLVKRRREHCLKARASFGIPNCLFCVSFSMGSDLVEARDCNRFERVLEETETNGKEIDKGDGKPWLNKDSLHKC
jgi:hypothetical protein